MKTYVEKERACQVTFEKNGPFWHVYTDGTLMEDIFCSAEDFNLGITLLAVCAVINCKVELVTFELMNNHAHIIATGTIESITNLFNGYKKLLTKCLNHNEHAPDLDKFNMHLHRINSLENMRNAIAYVNRNGSVVDRHVCPYSYPWGANKYFFNPEAKRRYEEQRRKITTREKRKMR